jgi:alkanesulfonate monooxygenase SsuD/methylene tetrahydromethanopterin reductase-like flavin-dependent oxidoreductase (luciferase family)
MKIGMLLHPERGVESVLEEARAADEQGFDSVWLFDHLLDIRGSQGPDGPLDSLILMTAIGAVTRRMRLAWAMLNPSFDYPAVLAKRLATLDQITHGRVICTLVQVGSKMNTLRTTCHCSTITTRASSRSARSCSCSSNCGPTRRPRA